MAPSFGAGFTPRPAIDEQSGLGQLRPAFWSRVATEPHLSAPAVIPDAGRSGTGWEPLSVCVGPRLHHPTPHWV